MRDPHKYGRIERERRFLLREFPGDPERLHSRRITDRYIAGTSLRLRRLTDENGAAVYKLTQKIPERSGTSQQGWITTMYISESEYDILARLPASLLRKTRYSLPPFGIDRFDGPLQGLILAEAEFDSEAEAAALSLPPFLFREVSNDERFTGGRLVCASAEDIRRWLIEYGIA